MGIELHHLRGFLALSEERHFTRAAERLHLSQPSLSRNIRRLEEALGVRLLERTTRRVALTPAGERLHAQLAHIMPLLEEALRPDRTGEVLRLGFTWGFPSQWAHEAMEEFTEATGVQVQPIRRDEPLAGLDHGDADIALLRGQVSTSRMRRFTLLTERRVMAAAAGSRYSRLTSIAWRDIAALPLVVNTVSGTTKAEDWPDAERPMVAATCTNFDEWLEAVAADWGVGCVPESIAHRHTHPSVVFIPVEGAPEIPMHLVFPRNGAHPLVPTFVSIAGAVTKRLREGDDA